jgi:hypothetical protein
VQPEEDDKVFLLHEEYVPFSSGRIPDLDVSVELNFGGTPQGRVHVHVDRRESFKSLFSGTRNVEA